MGDFSIDNVLFCFVFFFQLKLHVEQMVILTTQRLMVNVTTSWENVNMCW